MLGCLEQFDRLIRTAQENLEHTKGTIYEKYAEDQLKNLIIEREKFIFLMSLSN